MPLTTPARVRANGPCCQLVPASQAVLMSRAPDRDLTTMPTMHPVLAPSCTHYTPMRDTAALVPRSLPTNPSPQLAPHAQPASSPSSPTHQRERLERTCKHHH